MSRGVSQNIEMRLYKYHTISISYSTIEKLVEKDRNEETTTLNQRVTGSSPVAPTIFPQIYQ
jgi:hypothetical protein